MLQRGALSIVGNYGTGADFSIQGTDFRAANNISFTKSQTANGESLSTQFTAYDSLGSPVAVQATGYLQSLGTGRAFSFRFLLSGPSARSRKFAGRNYQSVRPQHRCRHADVQFQRPTVVRNGQQFYDLSATDRMQSPLQFSVNVNGISALSTQNSTLSAVSQDGSPPGTLSNYAIGPDGVIQGTFSNGSTRTLGQIVSCSLREQQWFGGDAK